jgi:hypothetical protein
MTEFSIFLGEGELTLCKLQIAFSAIEKNRERPVSINFTNLDFDNLCREEIFRDVFDYKIYELRTRHLYGAQVLIDKDLKESYLISDNKNIYRLKILQEEAPKYNVKLKFIAEQK